MGHIVQRVMFYGTVRHYSALELGWWADPNIV